jgi:hypothetical protein
MANRKQTPDILGNLLGGSEPAKKPADQSTIKPVDHNTGIPVNHKAIIPADQHTIKPAKKRADPKPAPKKTEAPGEKIKATFYISSDISDRLEEGWIQLRGLTPKDQRGDISKSLIVEKALQEVLTDLEKRGKDSLLAKKTSRP